MKITVKKLSHPILLPGIKKGNPLSWDSLWVYHPVITEKGANYYMLYTGKRVGKGIKHQIGVATSSNLKDWKKYPGNPVFVEEKYEEQWDSDIVAHAWIWKENGIYFMLYDGSKKNDWLEEIGLATSRDLIHWKRHENNPIFKVGKDWERRHVSRCCVYKERGIYYLFYAGHDTERERIGVAKGRDILSLKRFMEQPVLDIGKKNEWDGKSISDPRVIKHKDRYLMFYTGMDEKGHERVGVALSEDLLHWKKYKNNPILDVSEGRWDSISACRSTILKQGDQFSIFYSGRKNLFYSIGVAEMNIER